MRKFFQRSFMIVALATVPVLAVSGDAAAAFTGFLKIKGQTQGDFKGSGVTMKGAPSGGIKVLKVSHSIVSPRDAASGLPTGKRQHKVLEVTIEVGPSSPQIFEALVKNETLSQVVFTARAPSGAGKEVNVYEIQLQNAQVASYKLIGGEREDAPAARPGASASPDIMVVSFTYQRISWTWLEGGIVSQDDWDVPMEGSKAPTKPPAKKRPG
jgi:type VI secretion system secreted protein Hcp